MGSLRPAMEDSRFFTNYISSSILNEVVKDTYQRPTATSYRYFLQDKAENVADDLRTVDVSAMPPRRVLRKTFVESRPVSWSEARTNKPFVTVPSPSPAGR